MMEGRVLTAQEIAQDPILQHLRDRCNLIQPIQNELHLWEVNPCVYMVSIAKYGDGYHYVQRYKVSSLGMDDEILWNFEDEHGEYWSTSKNEEILLLCNIGPFHHGPSPKNE